MALARAFFGNPSLVVLDEPNASLDREGDEALFSAVQYAKANTQTLVMISHRPNLVQLADKVLVLQEGRMHLYGPRDEVMQQLQTAPAVKPTASQEQK